MQVADALCPARICFFLLALLHIEDSKEDESHISKNSSVSNQEETTVVECQHSTNDARLTRRPRRAAALKANDCVNACMYELNLQLT